MKTMIKYRPQNKIDGIRNIWILKPGNDSLGRGIVLKSSLVDILAKMNQAAKENVEYVVQKYIGMYYLRYKNEVKYFRYSEFEIAILFIISHICNYIVITIYRTTTACS